MIYYYPFNICRFFPDVISLTLDISNVGLISLLTSLAKLLSNLLILSKNQLLASLIFFSFVFSFYITSIPMLIVIIVFLPTQG